MTATRVRSPIRRLDRATIDRIAAGEVVERPASVVKELVENAVDAGARRIVVRLRRGGLDRIEVVDDGFGIPAEELPLALERHATSKLAPQGPIDSIRTLGFRGEALASIASVARLRLVSRPPEAALASWIEIEAGGPTTTGVEARAVGTTVEVHDLFAHTPARRKFLHAPAAEQIEVVATLERAYLARPSVALELEIDGRPSVSYPATDRWETAAGAVLGPSFTEQSFRLDLDLPGGGRWTAVLGRPVLAAPTSRRLYLAVNGRPIQSRPLSAAVRAAFEGLMPRTRFPVGLLHLTLPEDRIDVNVHPTKREIRIAEERELDDRLRREIRAALLRAPRPATLLDRGGAGPPRAGPLPARAGEGPASTLLPLRPTAPPLFGAPSPRPLLPLQPSAPLELRGSLRALYWIAESPDGLLLIDQHAASERLVFESIRRSLSAARQQLVDPVTLELSGRQQAALADHSGEVAASGFDIDPFGPRQIRLRAVPIWAGHRADAKWLLQLLDELADGGRPTVPDDPRDRIIATVACHAAVRAGDPIEAATLTRIWSELRALPEAPTTCPHGRPIAFEIPFSRIDRWFLRTGP
ncbi:MAG: DNA mismatch repair endonuclease MutL [Thermoplasmata archaeon]|jgi:DNA mismatch repair protein MutL